MAAFADDLAMLVTTSDDNNNEKLTETVKILKSKVDALFDRRQEDFKLLEEAFRSTLEKNLDLATLREEVNKLKKELASATQRNDHLRVQWVASGVTELRSEMAELQNTSTRLANELNHARTEVTLLKRDISSLRNLNSRINSKLLILETNLRNSKLSFKNLNNDSEDIDNRVEIELQTPRYRHHRVLRKRLEVVEMTNEAIGQAQTRLETRLQKLEHKLHVPSLLKPHIFDSTTEQRLVALEASDKKQNENLFNVTRQVTSLDKVHGSMLELLESVESLENKVDKSIPDLQREISKMEFNTAQISSTLAVVKEDQDNQRLSVKAMSGGLSAMQQKMDMDHVRLSSLETKFLNLTASAENMTTPLSNFSTDVQKSAFMGMQIFTTDSTSLQSAIAEPSLPATMQQLKQVISAYQAIREKLPNDCGEVHGLTGLYLVSPGESIPVITWCDQDKDSGGWTVIQRRKDGSEKFNRPWNDYVHGFGSAAGEFWLGNEMIHQLTKDNDTMLRIDLVDIYGKIWHAEYDEFSITSSEDSYRLHVGGYHGNASDALEYQNHMQFSTIDSDHDVSNTNCAANYEGGWWFSHCQHANLNGKYNLGLTWFDRIRNEWIAVSQSEMKLRRKNFNRT
ncbi:protein scabrous-like [Lycorma delicatula]|uniref:protein scabrous-like n=1 Tax=Lycorma delicatula TaxID=130591 RepID=UPI003F515914